MEPTNPDSRRAAVLPIRKILAGQPELRRLLLDNLSHRSRQLLQQLRVAANWDEALRTKASLDEIDLLASMFKTDHEGIDDDSEV